MKIDYFETHTILNRNLSDGGRKMKCFWLIQLQRLAKFNVKNDMINSKINIIGIAEVTTNHD